MKKFLRIALASTLFVSATSIVLVFAPTGTAPHPQTPAPTGTAPHPKMV
jgi:hypothetical protein